MTYWGGGGINIKQLERFKGCKSGAKFISLLGISTWRGSWRTRCRRRHSCRSLSQTASVGTIAGSRPCSWQTKHLFMNIVLIGLKQPRYQPNSCQITVRTRQVVNVFLNYGDNVKGIFLCCEEVCWSLTSWMQNKMDILQSVWPN